MSPVRALVLERLAALPAGATVIEAGTLRLGEHVRHHGPLLPPGVAHVKIDIQAGVDVDVVSDVHGLRAFGDNSVDAFLAPWLWEHLAQPDQAARAALRVLRPGGWAYVLTHFCFPEHNYPGDFQRWTRQGLAAHFSDAGFVDVRSEYDRPCTILPPPGTDPWCPSAPSWLDVEAIGTKPHD